MKVAEEFRLPIIADEIYEDMVFTGQEFTPLASLSDEAPVLSISGLAKQYLAPGWRVGWIVIHDRHERLKEVRAAINNLTMVIVGSNSLVQVAIPTILEKMPKDYYENLNYTLERHARIVYDGLKDVRGLKPVEPQGAMYVMVGIEFDKMPGIKDDLQFCKMLLAEQAVFVLPGSIFRADGFFRVVICPPEGKLKEAMARIRTFCEIHAKV